MQIFINKKNGKINQHSVEKTSVLLLDLFVLLEPLLASSAIL
jgi:hypothetical protein